MYFAYLRIHFPLDFHQLAKQYGSQVPAILKQEESCFLQGRQKSLFYSGNMYLSPKGIAGEAQLLDCQQASGWTEVDLFLLANGSI